MYICKGSSNNDLKKSSKLTPDDMHSTLEKNTVASKSLISINNNQNSMKILKHNDYNIAINTQPKYNIIDNSSCGSALATNISMRQKLEISLKNLESGKIRRS